MKKKRVLVWVLRVVFVLLVPYSVILTYLHFVENLAPFPDWGNAGFVFETREQRQAIVDVLRHFKLEPDYRVDTKDVSRAIYRGKFPFILDVASKAAAAKVDNPESFIAITVDDPHAAALWTRHALQERGYESQDIHNPDPELGEGKLSVVTSDVLPGKMLVFRRTIIHMGPKPPAWHDD